MLGHKYALPWVCFLVIYSYLNHLININSVSTCFVIPNNYIYLGIWQNEYTVYGLPVAVLSTSPNVTIIGNNLLVPLKSSGNLNCNLTSICSFLLLTTYAECSNLMIKSNHRYMYKLNNNCNALINAY